MTESWKNVLGVLESPGIFCKQEHGNPVYSMVVSHDHNLNLTFIPNLAIR